MTKTERWTRGCLAVVLVRRSPREVDHPAKDGEEPGEHEFLGLQPPIQRPGAGSPLSARPLSRHWTGRLRVPSLPARSLWRGRSVPTISVEETTSMAKDRRVQDPNARRDPDRSDVTPEVTGRDASASEASTGGLGPDLPYTYRESVENDDDGVRLEADPSHAEDIIPDQIERRERVSGEENEEEREITAQPREEMEPADELRYRGR